MKVKAILIFLLGVASGAAPVYFYMKNKQDREVERRVNEVIGNRPDPETPEGNKDEGPMMENPEEEKKEETIPDLTKYSQVLGKTDYTKAVVKDKVTTMTETIEEEAEKIVEQAKKTSKKTKVPKKVTQDEFDATSNNKRRTLYYYADGVLADDEDEVYDPVETMGATNFKNFKSTYDTVYIFNYALDFMFEIMPSNSRYADIK